MLEAKKNQLLVKNFGDIKRQEMHIKCPSSSRLQKTTIWRLPKEREIGTTLRLKRVLVTIPFLSHPSSRFELTRRRS
jgi:hypothetical protein